MIRDREPEEAEARLRKAGDGAVQEEVPGEYDKMKTNLDCIPCLQRQALKAVREASGDRKIQEQVLREVIDKLISTEWSKTPPELAHEIYKIVRARTGIHDPYRKLKRKSNDEILAIYSELQDKIKASDDPLKAAVKLAIAGNIMDFGALDSFNIHETINKVEEVEIDEKEYRLFTEKLRASDTLLFFADNAGEIVFDKLLLETLLNKKKLGISFVVKGGPIINDVTLEDAYEVGLNDLPQITFLSVSNGEPDTGPERNSQEVRSWITEHDLVISKGQGNYESLSAFKGIFFMLMAKCPLVASDLGVSEGDVVLRYNNGGDVI